MKGIIHSLVVFKAGRQADRQDSVSFPCLIGCFCLLACLLVLFKERENKRPWSWAGRDVRRLWKGKEEGESLITIYCMTFFQLKNKKLKLLKKKRFVYP